MKKRKLKSLVKDARKATRKDIKTIFYSEMKTAANKLVPASKKIEKLIKKNAGKLAKKISGAIVIDKAALLTAHKEQKNIVAQSTKTANTITDNVKNDNTEVLAKNTRKPSIAKIEEEV